MPRKNSTAWVPNAPITAVRLEDFNEDLDDAYATGSDHLKVYRLAADPALQVTIGAGTYRVGSVEGQYAGGTLTVGASVTTYIMINSAGVIQTSTTAWNGQYNRLAVVVSGASTITSITDWRNKVVGGDFGGNPTGVIVMWPTGTAPTGYLLCDGSAVSRTTYSVLFGVHGTTFGVGDGSTTFNLPNYKGRTPVGFDSTQTEFDAMGETGGANTHTLSTTEIPGHTHSVPGSNSPSGGLTGYAVQSNVSGSALTSGSTGGGQSHNNLQPYITINFIIKT